jgi:predicted nucleotidyltransferase
VETKENLGRAGVAVVYYFGSRASGTGSFFSDIDIGIVMEDKRLIHPDIGKLHLEIYDILSSDIPDKPEGPKLDLSFLQKANQALGMKAIRDGIVLFESDPRLRCDFEEYIFRVYNDYLKLQREFEEATLRAF